jgi:hypothetical protein
MEDMIQASHGETERTKILYGIQWAGTGLPEEMCEITCHLRELIDCGYPYLFMENYLMQMGYGTDCVRRAFRDLTGVSAENVVNINYTFSPGNIPRFNLGWGCSKKAKGEHYFVMPQGDWFMVYHQKGDDATEGPRREDISKHFTLEDAFESVEKLVVKLERWNPPVNEDKRVKVNKEKMYKQAKVFAQADKCFKFHNYLQTIHSSSERRALINQAFETNVINATEREQLLITFADDLAGQVTRDELQKMTDDSTSRPLKEETAERTPQQYFERQKMEHRYTTMYADIVDEIAKHIFDLNSNVKEFDVRVRAFKYNVVEPAGTGTPTPSDEQDVINANAWVAVLLDCVDKRSSAPYNTKLGMMVFEVIGSEISSSDAFKGEDNRQYAATDDGLRDYFSTERAHAPTTV